MIHSSNFHETTHQVKSLKSVICLNTVKTFGIVSSIENMAKPRKMLKIPFADDTTRRT